MDEIIDVRKAPVLCQDTLDHIGNRRYRVTVTGISPHKFTRVYTIDANSDKDAAFDGMRRFEKEMSRPLILLDS